MVVMLVRGIIFCLALQCLTLPCLCPSFDRVGSKKQMKLTSYMPSKYISGAQVNMTFVSLPYLHHFLLTKASHSVTCLDW
jgi:hypothetical protein